MPMMAFDPIAAALRELHQQALAERIPDDFLRLLARLDDGGASGGDEQGNENRRSSEQETS